MCQGAAVCEAEVVVLSAAVGMKARRSSGVSQPRIVCRSWKWVSKVSRSRCDRVSGVHAARSYGQGLMIAAWQAMRHGRRGWCIFSPPPSGIGEMGTDTICCGLGQLRGAGVPRTSQSRTSEVGL